MTNVIDKGWIQTATGGKFFPMKPCQGDLRILDIAHALAHTCRFNGHCGDYYSVAQHCAIMVSMLRGEGADTDTLKAALLHDVDEAYLPDVPRPVKPYLFVSLPPVLPIIGDKEGQPRLVAWSQIGNAIADKAALRYKLPIGFQDLPAVKTADARMLATEWRDLMSVAPEPCSELENVSPYREWIVPVGPLVARKLFIAHFVRLFPQEKVPTTFNAIGGRDPESAW